MGSAGRCRSFFARVQPLATQPVAGKGGSSPPQPIARTDLAMFNQPLAMMLISLWRCYVVACRSFKVPPRGALTFSAAVGKINARIQHHHHNLHHHHQQRRDEATTRRIDYDDENDDDDDDDDDEDDDDDYAITIIITIAIIIIIIIISNKMRRRR